jgi:hypothetical protein
MMKTAVAEVAEVETEADATIDYAEVIIDVAQIFTISTFTLERSIWIWVERSRILINSLV